MRSIWATVAAVIVLAFISPYGVQWQTKSPLKLEISLYEKNPFSWRELHPEPLVVDLQRESMNVVPDCMSTDAAKAFMRDRTWEITDVSLSFDKKLTVEAYEIADPQFPNVGTGRIHCMEIPYESFPLPNRIRVVDNRIAGVY